MKKISKKDLSLNKEMVASLSDNEMLQIEGGDVTGKYTAEISVCICKTVAGDIGCTGISQTHCDYTQLCAESVEGCAISVDCEIPDQPAIPNPSILVC